MSLNKSPMDQKDKKTLRLLIFRRTFSYLGIELVLSAIVGGLYQDTLHFVWALCAAGAILIAMGWFEYLRATNSLPFFKGKRAKKPQTPYIWRRDKQNNRHKPAFMQSAEDFEDDLTPYTTADAEILSEKLRCRAVIISRIAAGVLALIASFCIPQ